LSLSQRILDLGVAANDELDKWTRALRAVVIP
jgi:hypothetical protein